jgi:FkbM family methyltransferase
VLDLGAHIGTFGLAAAAIGCQVLAVEASPYNFSLLQASIDHNGFDRMQAIHAAVGDRQGKVEFMQAGPFGLVANPNVELPVNEVPAATVDQLLTELEWAHIDVIKMDVEGSEVAVIRGMPHLLAGADAPLILYESNGHTLGYFGETPRSLAAGLSEWGYNNYLVTLGRLVPITSSNMQVECNSDYLATKQTLDVPRGWRLSEPMSREEIISRVIAASKHPHEHHRAYIAQALTQADEWVLADKEVRRALSHLSADPHADVRQAASWWSGDGPALSHRLARLLAPVRASWQRRHRAPTGEK